MDYGAWSGSILGKRLVRIDRVYFEHGDTVDRSNGAVVLTFRDGSVLRFDSGPDGEGIVVEDSPWVDQFRETLTAHNREFISSSGKWTRYDETERSPYSDFVGSTVTNTVEVATESGKPTGYVISTDVGSIETIVEWDELLVRLLKFRIAPNE